MWYFLGDCDLYGTSTLYDSWGTSLLTMHLLAQYCLLRLNSHTPGICPPSPHHPPCHPLMVNKLTSPVNTHSADMLGIIIKIILLHLLKMHIQAGSKKSGYIAGPVPSIMQENDVGSKWSYIVMTTVHHACFCCLSRRDSWNPPQAAQHWRGWELLPPLTQSLFTYLFKLYTANFIDQSFRLLFFSLHTTHLLIVSPSVPHVHDLLCLYFIWSDWNVG